MRLRDLTCAGVALALSAFVAVSHASAEMQVIESNSARYPVGATLRDDATPTLAAGEQIKVLLLPSNRTKVFSGASKASPGVPGGTRGVNKQ